jgi:hypothetical protein
VFYYCGNHGSVRQVNASFIPSEKALKKSVDRQDVHRSFFDYAPIGKQKLFSEHPVCNAFPDSNLQNRGCFCGRFGGSANLLDD